MDASEASFAGSFAGILLKKDQEIQILKEKLLVKTKDYEILKQLSVKYFRKSQIIASTDKRPDWPPSFLRYNFYP